MNFPHMVQIVAFSKVFCASSEYTITIMMTVDVKKSHTFEDVTE